MESGQIIIDQSAFVTALITVFGALLSFTIAFLFMSVRYLINSFDKKLETCNKNISDKLDLIIKDTDSNEKSITHAHNRLSEHVDKHHTK